MCTRGLGAMGGGVEDTGEMVTMVSFRETSYMTLY